MTSEWQNASGELVFRDDWPEEPTPVLTEWLPDNEEPARPTMVVATVDESGAPDSRIQLLTAWDDHGFYFHTDTRSRKVAQLAHEPRVSFTVHLPAEAHQITVQGVAELADAAELEWAFAHRSAYLQQLAWQNTVEFASLPRLDRVSAWDAFAVDHVEGFTAPPTWTGYLVRPSRLTFWVGSTSTASRRVEYRRAAATGELSRSSWAVTQLAG
ncbi:pyridoxamine 5'-phosphate oxidase family protein [Lysinimonas soli]|uniref:Pyridoxamine 5'-phosphate oxidase family protein n=1 Tax=Lysinimonas soli TaxID=1074233 RepID=A0ABW0NS79_9MICO